MAGSLAGSAALKRYGVVALRQALPRFFLESNLQHGVGGGADAPVDAFIHASPDEVRAHRTRRVSDGRSSAF